MIKNPNLFFNKNKRTVKFHFDMMHGKGNLDKAIKLLEKKDRDDFDEFVNQEVSFNPHNMFIFKSYECRNYSNAENTDAEINQILKSLCLNTKFFKKISGNKY